MSKAEKPMSKAEPVDLSAFRAALEDKRIRSGLSARQLCRQIGLAETTYSRLMNGTNIGLSNFVVLSNWLGQPMEQFISAPQRDPHTRTTIANLLASDPVYVSAKPAVLAILDLAESRTRL